MTIPPRDALDKCDRHHPRTLPRPPDPLSAGLTRCPGHGWGDGAPPHNNNVDLRSHVATWRLTGFTLCQIIAIIIMDGNDLDMFVNLINEDYITSQITGKRYEIKAKRALDEPEGEPPRG